MALKFKLEKDEYEELDDSVKVFYNEKDGVYFLDVEGAVSNEQLKEFRQNNIDLTKENDKFKAELKKFEGIDDPEKAREAVRKLSEMDEEKLIAKDKLDELFAQRTERLKQDHQAQVDALEKRNTEMTSKYEELYGKHSGVVIDNRIQMAAANVGKIKEGAMRDIVSRGREVFKMDDNFKPVARDDDGNPMFSKDGTSPLSIEEWAFELPNNASYFFEETTGSDARGGGDKGPIKKMKGEQMMQLPPSERLKAVHRGEAK